MFTPWAFFFFNDTATTEIYTLSLHDALPIWCSCLSPHDRPDAADRRQASVIAERLPRAVAAGKRRTAAGQRWQMGLELLRPSEPSRHTSVGGRVSQAAAISTGSVHFAAVGVN